MLLPTDREILRFFAVLLLAPFPFRSVPGSVTGVPHAICAPHGPLA